MSPENRANVQFALMKMMKTACSNLSPAVLWLSSRRSHYHLQGQGGGGGAACGEGGHYHLGVDGLLPVLRVHAQHRHLRPGQVAGETELLECVFLSLALQIRLWHINTAGSDEVEDLLYAFCCMCLLLLRCRGQTWMIWLLTSVAACRLQTRHMRSYITCQVCE